VVSFFLGLAQNNGFINQNHVAKLGLKDDTMSLWWICTTSESREVGSVWVKIIHITQKERQDFTWKHKSKNYHEEEDKNPL